MSCMFRPTAASRSGNALLDRAAPLGLKPYGLEALASLRIEKGHVAGLELDHRNTLDDLGLGKMAASAKPYVGRELRERADLRAAERWSLVGLECLEPGARLRGGAILFARGEAITGHGRGYISSVTWSTVLDKYIALGLYQGGLKHVGEEIRLRLSLEGRDRAGTHRAAGVRGCGRGAPACLRVARRSRNGWLSAAATGPTAGARCVSRRFGAGISCRSASLAAARAR